MSRATKYIIIEGQFASGVLGTFRIIRGFATLQDLASISAPFPMTLPALGGAGVATVDGYQRKIDIDHANAIKRYLQEGGTRFIPEIILSIRGEFRDVVDAQQKVIGVEPATQTAGLWVGRKYKSRTIVTHQIWVTRRDLPRLVHQEQRIRRIDGNHRLHLAAELVVDATSPTKYLAPFCAILLGPPDNPNDNYVESMLFHTINSTGLLLDSEHALRLVLGQPANFGPASDEEFNTSPQLYLTRQIKEKMDRMPAIKRERLGATPATVLNSAARAIIAAKPALADNREATRAFADDLCGAIDDILARLPSVHPEFCKAEFFIELASLAWNETSEGLGHDHRINEAVKTLDAMGNWLGRDGFHRIETKRSMAEQLFEIFRAVRNRIPTRIFLSRWYPVDADGDELRKAIRRKDMIERALGDLKGENINLALDDPGTSTGGTFPIHKEMYDAIANDEIILVDLSGVRPNVCIEAGYALDYHKKGRLLFIFQPTAETPNNPKYDRPPFYLTTFRYEPLTDAADIPDKIKPHLRTIWHEAIAGRL
jgi:hypothetical protein